MSQTIGDLFPEWHQQRKMPMYIGPRGPERPVMHTDIVKGVVRLDRQKFTAANAAKKKAHICVKAIPVLYRRDLRIACRVTLDHVCALGHRTG